MVSPEGRKITLKKHWGWGGVFLARAKLFPHTPHWVKLGKGQDCLSSHRLTLEREASTLPLFWIKSGDKNIYWSPNKGSHLLAATPSYSQGAEKASVTSAGIALLSSSLIGTCKVPTNILVMALVCVVFPSACIKLWRWIGVKCHLQCGHLTLL